MASMNVVAFLSKRGDNRWSGKVKKNTKLPEGLWLNMFKNEGQNKEGEKEYYFSLGFYPPDDDDDDDFRSKKSKSSKREEKQEEDEEEYDENVPF